MIFEFYNDRLKDIETLSVDGIAPKGTNLSHWPNNRTPKEFAAVTSTEICLNFIKHIRKHNLEPQEDILTINHYDTDGFLSLCSILYPSLSLKHEHLIKDSALTGDFRRFTSLHALRIDLTVTELSSNLLSPIRVLFEGINEEAKKRQIIYEELFKLYPTMLSYLELDKSFRYLWAETETRILEELIKREGIHYSFYKEFDFAIIESPSPLHDITINTLTYPASRILSVVKNKSGIYYDFKYTVDSWFTFGLTKALPRRELTYLCAILNKKERNGLWISDDIASPTSHLSLSTSSSIPVDILTDDMLSLFKKRDK